jgi:N-acetylglucosaminyldiphosphoundecaprenol N-acetyl-beta-D-mannosaminyltransferase
MLELCRRSVQHGFRHFLYGGVPGVAEELARRLTLRVPGLKIVGTYTPPFRPLNEEEESNLRSQVAACRPDIFWVGLSTPKQEKFMAQYLDTLDTKLMIGVGAAFDIHTGRITDAPQWMKIGGLQWLHRLIQEPRRLWKRYLLNNPRFVLLIALQLAGIRKYATEGLEQSPGLIGSFHRKLGLCHVSGEVLPSPADTQLVHEGDQGRQYTLSNPAG